MPERPSDCAGPARHRAQSPQPIPANGSAPRPAHYDFIDALRGLAFLAVFMLHASLMTDGLPPLLGSILGRGYAGVQLFFVVSALTLAMSLKGRASEPAPLTAFYIRRLLRIAPMFWCAMALYLLSGGLGPRWGAPQGLTSTDVALATLFLHGFDLYALNGVVPGGWSVAVEMQFYLLLPLLLSFANSLKRTAILLAAMIVVSALSLPVLDALARRLYPGAPQGLVHEFAFFSLPTQLPVFGCGLLLYRLLGPDREALARFEKYLPANVHWRAVLILLVVLALGLPIDWSATPLALVRHFPGHIGYGVLFALSAYALARAPLRLLVNPITRFLGDISYSAYLLHFSVLEQVDRLVRPIADSRPLLHLALLGCGAFFATALFAAVTRRLIERPGIEIGRMLIARIAPRPARERLADEMLVGGTRRE